MTNRIDEKLRWSADGYFLGGLVIDEHSNPSMPDSYTVHFNRDVVYEGNDYREALQTFMMYEDMF